MVRGAFPDVEKTRLSTALDLAIRTSRKQTMIIPPVFSFLLYNTSVFNTPFNDFCTYTAHRGKRDVRFYIG